MFKKRDNLSMVMAEHGRWITRIRDDVRLLEQRMRGLERRVAMLEQNLARMGEFHRKIDPALSSLQDELVRLSSSVDSLVESRRRMGGGRHQK